MFPAVAASDAAMEPWRVEGTSYAEVATIGCRVLHRGVAGGPGMALVPATFVAHLRDVFLEDHLLARTLLQRAVRHPHAKIISYVDCVGSFGTRGLLCGVSCMDGSTAYMAINRARAVGIRREGRIQAPVATDFFFVQCQCGNDRADLIALGGQLGGEGALRLVTW